MKLAADACFQCCETFCDKKEIKLLINMSDERYNNIEESFGDFIGEVKDYLDKEKRLEK